MPDRVYPIKKAAEIDILPASSYEELDSRVRELMNMQVRKSRPSDLGRRVSYIEAVLREKGIMPDGNDQGIQSKDASTGEAELQP